MIKICKEKSAINLLDRAEKIAAYLLEHFENSSET